ncbi:MAG: hypothetical protein U0X73_11720 [Thermoanaerobaculia bacterium]
MSTDRRTRVTRLALAPPFDATAASLARVPRAPAGDPAIALDGGGVATVST